MDKDDIDPNQLAFQERDIRNENHGTLHYYSTNFFEYGTPLSVVVELNQHAPVSMSYCNFIIELANTSGFKDTIE
jgi:hypothetical protein